MSPSTRLRPVIRGFDQGGAQAARQPVRRGGSVNPRCRTLLEYGHARSPSRRAERASDLGGDTGNRTPDLLLAKQALYQLSYVPEGTSSCAEPAWTFVQLH